MTIILKSFKYRIYPSQDQETIINKTFGCVRFVWNKLVENFNTWSPTNKPSIVTEKTLKDDLEYPWLKEVNAASLQQKRIDFEATKKTIFQ